MKKNLFFILILGINTENINCMNKLNQPSQETQLPQIASQTTTITSFSPRRIFYKPPIQYSLKKIREIKKFLEISDRKGSPMCRPWQVMEERLEYEKKQKRKKITSKKSKKKWHSSKRQLFLEKVKKMHLESVRSSIRINRIITRIPEKSVESAQLSQEQTVQPPSVVFMPRSKPIPLLSDSERQQSSSPVLVQTSILTHPLIPVSVPFSVPTPIPAIPKQTTMPSSALLPRPNPVLFTSKTISESSEVSTHISTIKRQTSLTSAFSNTSASTQLQTVEQQNSNTIVDDIEPVTSPWPWPTAIHSTPLKIVYYPKGAKFNQSSYSKLPELSKSGSISDDIESTSPILFSSPDPNFFKN